MQHNQDIIRTLATKVDGGLAGLGRELVRRSGKNLTDHRAIWNWTVRGVPHGWRYWVAEIAAEQIEGFDRDAFMRGPHSVRPPPAKQMRIRGNSNGEAA